MRKVIAILALITVISFIVLIVVLMVGPDAQVRQAFAERQLAVQSTVDMATVGSKIEQANFDAGLERVKSIVGFAISTLFQAGLGLIVLIFIYRHVTDTSWIGRIANGLRSLRTPTSLPVGPVFTQMQIPQIQVQSVDAIGQDAIMRQLPPFRAMTAEEEAEITGVPVEVGAEA